MAEIKIEKKKPSWPWVLLVLIILAAIFFFWYYNDRDLDSNDDMLERDTITQVETPYQNQNEIKDTSNLYAGNYGTVRKETSLADYFTFVDNKDNRTEDKSFYRTAFFKLITATKRQSEIEMVDVSDNISEAMKNAENLTNTEATTAKVDNAKKAAEEVAKALKTIQEKEFDNLGDDADEVQKAASAIDANQTYENQSNNLNTFFDKSARLLQKMNDNEDNR